MYKNVLIIPYRHREKHLEFFLENTWPLIEKNMESTKLVIVEQNDGKKFNRGMVLNIGYDLHKDATYLFFNDVDTNPTEKTILSLYKRIPDENEIISIYSAECSYLGGNLKIRAADFKEINGFPNDFWGWGIEDRVLYNRSVYFNKRVQRNLFQDNVSNNDIILFNDVNDRNHCDNFGERTSLHYNQFLNLSKELQYNQIMSSGLNNLQYTIMNREYLMPNVEQIKVECV